MYRIFSIFSNLYIISALLCLTFGNSLKDALRDRYIDECSEVEDCDRVMAYGEAYKCEGGRCICHPDATFDEEQKRCVCKDGYVKIQTHCKEAPPIPGDVLPSGAAPAAAPAQSLGTCSNDNNCGNYQVCNNTWCVCEKDYVAINRECKLAARIVGDSCEDNVQCTTNLGGYGVCDASQHCVCMENSVPVLGQSQCALKAVLGEPCKYSEQCQHIEHASCSPDACLCDSTHVNDGIISCLPIIHNYNESCLIPTQCHMGKLGEGATCEKLSIKIGFCRCLDSYYYKGSASKCLQKRGIGESCDDKNIGCYLDGDGDNQGIDCIKNKCACKKGFKLSEDKLHCNGGLILHSSFYLIIASFLYSRRM